MMRISPSLRVGRLLLVLAAANPSIAAFSPSRLLRATGRTTARHIILFSSAEDAKDDEIERLRSMAAKLRSEAAALEVEQQEKVAKLTQTAFDKFDMNKDGEISMQELKEGLEKLFKAELSDRRVKKLLDQFDASGDGALQLDEFVTVDQFRNKLDTIAREEKAAARAAAKLAEEEESQAKLLQATLELVNEREPTGTDRILSVVPYLFPLLDSLQFARFLVIENPENVASQLIALLYALYRSIPFGGFIAFFALVFLGQNLRINRLIRYNMQQAIYLDIALFFPGLLAGLYALLGQQLGLPLPPSLVELGNDVVFFTMLALIGYSSISSLLGITPDKLPLISQAVNDRVLSIDMFDSKGRFVGKRDEKEKKDD